MTLDFRSHSTITTQSQFVDVYVRNQFVQSGDVPVTSCLPQAFFGGLIPPSDSMVSLSPVKV
jgi:hypothetical protein